MKKSFSVILIILLFCFACKKENAKDSIDYPETGLYGENLLDKLQTSYQANSVSFSAILGDEAIIKVKIVGGKWKYTSSNNAQWSAGDYNEDDRSRIFTSISSGTIDGRFEIYPGTSMEIFVYENGAENASWTKSIEVE